MGSTHSMATGLIVNESLRAASGLSRPTMHLVTLRLAALIIAPPAPAGPPNKALHLTWHSAFQSRSGSILASTWGASATVGGLSHAAERLVVGRRGLR